MSTCKKCGTEFEGNFCPECGTKFTYLRICPSCGEEVRGRFCIKCGTRYKEGTEEADADVVLPSYEKTGGENAAAKICPKCGAVVRDRFCSACGTEYVGFRGYCPRCGAKAEGEYCSACGRRLFAATYGNPVNPSVKRNYRALVRMPIILFLALAVLLTGAYFGRYAWGRYSSFNVYSMADDLSTYLFVFFIACAATAITLFIIGMLYGTKKYRHYNLFQAFGIVGIVFMSVSCANGAVTWTWMGSTPAAVMISVFSVSCLITSVVCLVLSKILVSDDKEYAAAELADRKIK